MMRLAVTGGKLARPSIWYRQIYGKSGPCAISLSRKHASKNACDPSDEEFNHLPLGFPPPTGAVDDCTQKDDSGRVLKLLIASWVLIATFLLCTPAPASPDQGGYRDWLLALSGTWRFASSDGISGTIELKPILDGKAVLGGGTDSNGASTIWAWMWSEAENKLLLTWFSAETGTDYGIVKFDVTKSQLMGEYLGLIGGQQSKANVIVTKSRNVINFDWFDVQIGARELDNVRRVMIRE